MGSEAAAMDKRSLDHTNQSDGGCENAFYHVLYLKHIARLPDQSIYLAGT